VELWFIDDTAKRLESTTTLKINLVEWLQRAIHFSQRPGLRHSTSKLVAERRVCPVRERGTSGSDWIQRAREERNEGLDLLGVFALAIGALPGP